MNETKSIFPLIAQALRRARIPILTVALVYFVSVVTGIIMVHTGNTFAISTRNQIVSGAQSSPVLVSLGQGSRLQAALLDFWGNLVAGVTDLAGGLGVVFPYPIAAYRGWVGGIVSIDGSGASRLGDLREAVYYLVTLVLQLIPYSLAGGAGVNLGLSLWRAKPYYQGKKWLGVSQEAIWDALRIFLLVVPLFLIASLWEFLMV